MSFALSASRITTNSPLCQNEHKRRSTTTPKTKDPIPIPLSNSKKHKPTTRSGTPHSASFARRAEFTTIYGCCGARKSSRGQHLHSRRSGISQSSTIVGPSTAATPIPTAEFSGRWVVLTGHGDLNDLFLERSATCLLTAPTDCSSSKPISKPTVAVCHDWLRQGTSA